MTIFNGTNEDFTLIVQPLADYSDFSPNVISVTDSSFNPTAHRLSTPSEEGTLLHNPVSPSHAPLTRISAEGVNSHMYSRFIRQDGATRLDGQDINVGVIREDDEISQTLWNGFDDFVTVSSIAYSYASSGVSVIAPIVSEEYRYYEERPLEINITITGDTFFDVDITITFSNGATSVFTVRGQRQPIKEFTYLSQANWKGGLAIETQYLTSIYKASETSETRQALRVNPVRKMKYEMVSVGEVFSTVLWGFMQGLTARRTYLPLFQDGSVATADSSGNRIFCNTRYKRYYSGDQLLIVFRRYDRSSRDGTETDESIYYTATISSVNDDYIDVLTLPSEISSVPKNSMVFPGLYSEIAIKGNKFNVFKETGAIAVVEIKEVFGATTLQATNDSYTPTLYYGDAFLDLPLNWDELPQVSVGRDMIKTKGGRYDRYTPRSDFSTGKLTLTISAHTREEWWEMTGFLNYIKGRLRAFWVKHPLAAYILGTYTLFSGSDIIEMEVQTRGGINNTYSLQAVWVKSSIGEEEIIKVTGIRAGFTSSSVILELDPTTITDIIEVRRAFLVRNTSDKVKEQWFTDDGVVEVKLKTIELPGGYS